jgi:hypothetical protein
MAALETFDLMPCQISIALHADPSSYFFFAAGFLAGAFEGFAALLAGFAGAFFAAAFAILSFSVQKSSNQLEQKNNEHFPWSC